MSPFAQAAHDYAAEGIAVFPLRIRDKPPLPHSNGKDAASNDVEIVTAWWSGARPLPPKPDWKGRPPFAGPTCNVGIATGAVSGFWVLDIDGALGNAAVAALEAVHGALPATVEQSTGKGRHLCFRWDPARPVKNLSKGSRERIGAEIDVRGEGGYIVAPPSVHPSGRIYAWLEGRSPHELAFAAAPNWLMDLVAPIEAPAAPPQPTRPRARVEGNATPYGEKALDGVCADLRRTGKGKMNDAIWLAACRVGSLCAGGEITSESYALTAVRNAARDMVSAAGRKWTEAREEDTLQRGFKVGLADPASAPERHGPQPAAQRQTPATKPAAEAAQDLGEAQALWSAARSAWCAAARSWLEGWGLRPDATEALALWRAHPSAPWGRDEHGPALLAPLIRDAADLAAAKAGRVEALAVLPLHPRCSGFAHKVGDHAGRVVALTELDSTEPLLVAMGVGDGWALHERAGFRLRSVVAPSLRTFAGGALGDRYGRVNPDMPALDPASPAWTLPGVGSVYLAVRQDLRPPSVRVRRAGGGTMDLQIKNTPAARFYGALAEQWWQRAEANAVRLLTPEPGRMGFNPGRDG